MSQSVSRELEQLIDMGLDHRFVVARVLAKDHDLGVFGAVDAKSGRRVTLEVVVPENRARKPTFWASADWTGSSSHPSIVKILDVCATANGVGYAVMEALVGETLSMQLKHRRRLTLVESTEIAIAVADVLEVIHSTGGVHGNLHPARIFIAERSGRRSVKLAPGLHWQRPVYLDASLQRLIRPRRSMIPWDEVLSICMPLSYCPPEHLLGKPLSAQADVYGLAALLYEMLCGVPPHFAARPAALAARRLSFAPHTQALEMPSALRSELERALACEPSDRHPSACAFAKALARTLASKTLHPSVAPAPKPPAVPKRRTSHRSHALRTSRFDVPARERGSTPTQPYPRELAQSITCAPTPKSRLRSWAPYLIVFASGGALGSSWSWLMDPAYQSPQHSSAATSPEAVTPSTALPLTTVAYQAPVVTSSALTTAPPHDERIEPLRLEAKPAAKPEQSRQRAAPSAWRRSTRPAIREIVRDPNAVFGPASRR